MKKKMFLFAAGIAAALLVTGCGNKSQEVPKPQEEAAVPDTEEAAPKPEEGGSEPEGPDEDNSPEQSEKAPLRIWGTVTEVEENSILVDNQSENSSKGEIVLNVDPSQNRVIDAVTGFPVELSKIGQQSFEAYLGEAMTMSLPPQSTPKLVIVNIPEDGRAPQYAVAAGALEEEDGVYVLTATDGRSYQVPQDVEVLPFLTRNIVKLEDIAEGTECLIWLDEEDKAEKIVLFAE